jgi:hypothetical protein
MGWNDHIMGPGYQHLREDDMTSETPLGQAGNINRTDHKCVVCEGYLEQTKTSFRLPGAGPAIYGPGERDNWGEGWSEPFCPRCGLKYDQAALLKLEEERLAALRALDAPTPAPPVSEGE